MSRAAFLLFSTCLLALAAPARGDATVVVHGTGRALGVTPIAVAVPDSVPAGAYVLKPKDSGDAVPASVLDDRPTHTASRCCRVSRPRASRFSRLAAQEKPALGVAIIGGSGDNPNLHVTLDGKPFTTLVLTEATKPYFYPLIGPTGKSFTRSFPMEKLEGEDHDHNHQRSFWITHGNVNGYDFWGADPLNGTNPKAGRIQPRDVHATPGRHGRGTYRHE